MTVNIRIQGGSIGSLLINDTAVRINGGNIGSLTIRTAPRFYTRPTLFGRLTKPLRNFAAWWRDLQPADRLGNGLAFTLIFLTVVMAIMTPFELQARAQHFAAQNAMALHSTNHER